MKILNNIEQGTEEWLLERMNCVTGTKLKKVLGNEESQRHLIAELISEEMTGQLKSQASTSQMERGNAEEVFSIKEFANRYNKKVDTVGMIKSDEGWYGLSPDGVIYNEKGVITEAYETKCPDSKNRILYEIENALPFSETGLMSSFVKKDELYEALDEKGIEYDPKSTMKDLELLLPEEDRGKPSTKAPWHGIPYIYKPQCLHYFINIDTLERLYFGIYDNRIKDPEKKLYVVVLERKDIVQDIAKAKNSLEAFRKKWLKWKEIINPSNF